MWDNGNMDEMQYSNGKYHGIDRVVFKDGVYGFAVWKEGKKFGEWRMYHPNGQLKSHVHYDDEENMTDLM